MSNKADGAYEQCSDVESLLAIHPIYNGVALGLDFTLKTAQRMSEGTVGRWRHRQHQTGDTVGIRPSTTSPMQLSELASMSYRGILAPDG